MFLQDFDLAFIHTPGTDMGPTDALSRLPDPDTSSDNADITLLPANLFIQAIDTSLIGKITSLSSTDPLILTVIKSLHNSSPLFPRSTLTDWQYTAPHLYFKNRLYILLMPATILSPQSIHPSPLATEVSSAHIPCCLMTIGGQVCLPLFAISSQVAPFASK